MSRNQRVIGRELDRRDRRDNALDAENVQAGMGTEYLRIIFSALRGRLGDYIRHEALIEHGEVMGSGNGRHNLVLQNGSTTLNVLVTVHKTDRAANLLYIRPGDVELTGGKQSKGWLGGRALGVAVAELRTQLGLPLEGQTVQSEASSGTGKTLAELLGIAD